MLPSISDYTTLFVDVGDLTAVSEFTNVQPFSYWSGTEFTPGIRAWLFFPASGVWLNVLESFRLSAVAVRPGDVAAPAPEPQTLALALLALGAAAVARRRRPR